MATKSNGIEPSTEWARGPPVSGPAWQRFLKAIYNPEEKSFLGRTAKRWGIVFTFYAVFYAVLALLFALCMAGLFFSLDSQKPKWIMSESLIGANPGVAFRPRPYDGITVKYRRDNSSHFEQYIQQLEEFLLPYSPEGRTTCFTNDTYGFPDTPCFYIKLNKIYGWEPDYYSDKSSLPADMPEDLVEHIQEADHPAKNKQVWISCVEESGNGTVLEYPWGRGLPATFYPYLNQPGYRSPILAVRVLAPVNTLTIIRCRAWAKNIFHKKSIKEPSGYTRILLHIEDPTTE